MQARLEFFGATVSLFVAALAVSTGNFVPPQYLAIALSFSFTIPSILASLMGVLAEAEARYFF